MIDSRKMELTDFEGIIGIKFEKIELLDTALTHSSYSNHQNSRKNDYNERLEFLGDAVLSLVVSEYLYKKYKAKTEGVLTKIRAGVVCEGSLAEVSRSIKLQDYMKIGKGEELSGGRNKDSILADACEALIAAAYLDSGLDTVREFILFHLKDKIKRIAEDHAYNDYKTKLQEFIQKNRQASIKYVVKSETGPAHDRRFEINVFIDEKSMGIGIGKSKKEAEQNAAKEALINLGVDSNVQA